MIFEFFTEDGQFKMDYADYVKSPELMAKVGDDSRKLVNLGLRIISFDLDWLDEHPKQRRFVEEWEAIQAETPLRFFLPHCANSPDFNTTSHAFINDDYNVVNGMIAGNRFGKSTLVWIKMMVRYGLIVCEPTWEIFTEHGVNYNEFLGPRRISMTTYNWNNHRDTVWPQVIKAWTPRSELGEYVNWDMPKVTTGETIPLTCGSAIKLMACSQPQGAAESEALDNCGWDEQGTEGRFDGMNARMKTKRRFKKDADGFEHIRRGAHSFGLTPHHLPDRPDSGAGSWIHQMYTGELTKGLSVRFYHGNLHEDVPDWCYPEREKENDRKAMDEARDHKDRKRLRQLESRIKGEWEETGGMVYDEWDEEVHVINDFPIPSNWCAVRLGDHGRTNPSAWVWLAISPDSDVVMFREFELAAEVSTVVRNVVERSGNTLRDDGTRPYGQQLIHEYTEVEDHECYVMSTLDGRTFRNPDNNTALTVGDLYQVSGLRHLEPSPIGDIAPGLLLVKELLKVDDTRIHLETGQKGAPRFYVFQSCTMFRRHISNYRNRPVKGEDGVLSEKPRAKDDHDLDALRYGVTKGLYYVPTRTIREDKHEKFEKRRKYHCPEDRPGFLDRRKKRRSRRDPNTGY